MSVKVAINGFGRIGRLAFRQMFGAEGYEVVAINDLTSAKMLAHLLKYDSTQGNYVAQGHTVDFHEGEGEDNYIVVDGKKIVIYKMPNAADLPWGKLGVDVVLECTGFYTSKAKAQAHIDAGAKKVVISAPAGNDLKTIVFSVNENTLTKDDTIISAASCTTNCLAPLAYVIHKEFGIEQSLMSTIHASTAKQKAVDSRGGSDWRTGRSILNNIIPSSTGAAKAVGRVIPELYGKMTGMSFRVPTADVSVVDLTAHLKVKTTYADICYAIRHASETYMKGIIGYTADQVVSTDLIGNSCPCIFDETAGIMLDNDFVKLIAWYDNEWGYSNMVVRLLEHMVAVDEGRVTPEKRVVPKDKPKEEPAAKEA